MTALPAVETTPIPGLLVVRLDRREDERGFFKENWQREKMVALGLPDFGPVQHNIAFNVARGVTRGIHTEPWDKLVSLATGRVFGAWVDMREGDTFGTTFTLELDTSVAVFVPRGVGNSYQVLEDATSYSYLVNDHWRPGTDYPALNLADETIAIGWPIPLASAEVSAKDRVTPRLGDVTPMRPRRTLVLGGGGQVGRALAAALPDAHVVTRDDLDITDSAAVEAWPWQDYGVVVNAAAHTGVDDAETPAGRAATWAVNAVAPARLAALATEHRLVLVHYSTDYVFDGTRELHDEGEPLTPLGTYGQAKAAGELAVATTPRHYVLRTSWVIGDGPNFVRTMQSLAARGVSPEVVADPVGRRAFADELARVTARLLETEAPYGVVHVSNSGPPTTWYDVAREVFRLSGRDPDDVSPTTTTAYADGVLAQGRPFAPRPLRSTLSLAKLQSLGIAPEDAGTALARYLARD